MYNKKKKKGLCVSAWFDQDSAGVTLEHPPVTCVHVFH